MSQPDETPTSTLPHSPSFDIPSPTGDPSAGPSIENPASLDHEFQIVVFKVENTLFQVLRISFNVPGTPFEAMFALPQALTDCVEGSSLENPIHLPGIKAVYFRSFLRILYPFTGQKTVVLFDEWVGVLNLATMWHFQEIRTKAISQLSDLIKQKTAMERIALAREYRVAEWLRDAYLDLTQTPFDFDELRPAEPYFNPLNRNWEADAKKWEATIRDWETLARIFHLQTKVATSIMSYGANKYCSACDMCFGLSKKCLCKCRLLSMVDKAFGRELESFSEDPVHVEHLSIS